MTGGFLRTLMDTVFKIKLIVQLSHQFEMKFKKIEPLQKIFKLSIQGLVIGSLLSERKVGHKAKEVNLKQTINIDKMALNRENKAACNEPTISSLSEMMEELSMRN